MRGARLAALTFLGAVLAVAGSGAAGLGVAELRTVPSRAAASGVAGFRAVVSRAAASGVAGSGVAFRARALFLTAAPVSGPLTSSALRAVTAVARGWVGIGTPPAACTVG